jgi:hypothetical protein
VADVVEPRAKVKGQDFPGALGPHDSAGSGATVVLRGAAVAVSEYSARAAVTRGEFIDTWGPGGDGTLRAGTCYFYHAKVSPSSIDRPQNAALRRPPPDKSLLQPPDAGALRTALRDGIPDLPGRCHIPEAHNQFEPLLPSHPTE